MALHEWQLDQAHSEVHFKIKHLLISNISGSFRMFTGTLKTKETYNFNNAAFDIAIDVFSIDTNSTERDEHLKSADFFDADIYPEIRFVSETFTHLVGDNYNLKGNLTIKGITKNITLAVLFGGNAKDGFGLNRAGFEITGNINRNDFNIHANDITETGGLIIGDNIKLQANVQFTNKPEETNNDF